MTPLFEATGVLPQPGDNEHSRRNAKPQYYETIAGAPRRGARPGRTRRGADPMPTEIADPEIWRPGAGTARRVFDPRAGRAGAHRGGDRFNRRGTSSNRGGQHPNRRKVRSGACGAATSAQPHWVESDAAALKGSAPLRRPTAARRRIIIETPGGGGFERRRMTNSGAPRLALAASLRASDEPMWSSRLGDPTACAAQDLVTVTPPRQGVKRNPSPIAG